MASIGLMDSFLMRQDGRIPQVESQLEQLHADQGPLDKRSVFITCSPQVHRLLSFGVLRRNHQTNRFPQILGRGESCTPNMPLDIVAYRYRHWCWHSDIPVEVDSARTGLYLSANVRPYWDWPIFGEAFDKVFG